MLPKLRGATLDNLDWSTFSIDRVLQYYDGPRLLLRESSAGQLYLAWWSDSDDEAERWIYLPLSNIRLHEILSGMIPSLDGLTSPEDGYILVVDKDSATDSIVRAVPTVASDLPEDTLPRPGATLNIPIPEEISDFPSREGTHLLNVKLQAKSTDVTKMVSAKTASQFTGNLQRLLDAVGQATRGNPTQRGSIPDNILNQTRLDPVGMYGGSFGIRFETCQPDDLFGYSLVKRSLDRLFDLFDVGHEASDLTSQLTELKGRVANYYKDFLSTIETSLKETSLTWNQPSKPVYRQYCIDNIAARNVIAQIEAASDSIQENQEVNGTLVGANVRTRRFEVTAADTQEKIEGSIHKECIPKFEQVTLNSKCRVVLEPSHQLNEVTGEERTTYILLNIYSD